MGSSESSESIELTHDELYKLTSDSRNMANFLLTYVLKEMQVQDFLTLSNPTECNKYVVFLANQLYKHFYSLQISPDQNDNGPIFFRHTKDLINTSDKKKQSLCLMLSYYYTRIFQIYGALALTLIDDADAMSKSGFTTLTNDYLYAPGHVHDNHYIKHHYRNTDSIGGSQSVGSQSVGSQLVGGAYLKNFIFLEDYLLRSNSEELEYEPTSVDSRGKVTFTLNDDTIRLSNYLIQRTGNFKLTPYGYSPFSVIIKSIHRIDTYDYELKVEKIIYKNKRIPLPDDLPDKIRISKHRNSDPYKVNNKTIPEYFNRYFGYLIKYFKKYLDDSDSDSDSDSDTYKKYYKTHSDKKMDIHKMLAEIGKKMAHGTEKGTSEPLALGTIITNMTRVKPLGHCIARALKLLKTEPLQNDPGITQICKSQIFEKYRDTKYKDIVEERRGMIEKGQSLEEHPGLYATSLLFYDFIDIGTPKIVIGDHSNHGNPSSISQYMNFMRTMSRLFEGDKNRSDADLMKGLKAIKNRRDNEICGSVNKVIPLDSNITNEVYDVVKKLFKIQYEHATKCGTVFKMLFEIQKTSGQPQIRLHPNVVSRGFPEIDRINRHAREILVDYYTNCERTYLNGMQIIMEDTVEKATTKDLVNIIDKKHPISPDITVTNPHRPTNPLTKPAKSAIKLSNPAKPLSTLVKPLTRRRK
jgi:hypothetical protein